MPDNLKVQIAPDTYVLAYKASTYLQACTIASYLAEVQIKLDIRSKEQRDKLQKLYPNRIIYDRCNN